MRRGAFLIVIAAALTAWGIRRNASRPLDLEGLRPTNGALGSHVVTAWPTGIPPSGYPPPTSRQAPPSGDGAADGLLSAVTGATRPLFPGHPRQLVSGGCCTGAWWSADGTHLLYVDRPADSPVAALWGIATWPPGGQPEVVDASAGFASGAARFTVRPAGDYSLVRNIETGEEWPLQTGASAVLLSPDGQRAVWWDASGGREDVDALINIHGSDALGRSPRLLTSLWGATVVAFLPDQRRVLAIGRPIDERPIYAAVTLDVDTGAMVEIANGLWLADALLSPDGHWIAYLTSLDRVHPERNGIWVAPLDGAGHDTPRKMDFVGAYRWRRDGQLLYVPMTAEEPTDSIWQYDATTGSSVRLVGPEAGIRIAGNEWSASKDGDSVAWLDAADRNLWLIDLP